MLKTSTLGQLSRFTRDRRGVSAVEFAIIAPVMIGLYLGCVEVSDGVAADRKVSLVVDALANLPSQVTTISTANMTDILNAASSIMAPYSASNLKATVSCLKIDTERRGDGGVERRHGEWHGARGRIVGYNSCGIWRSQARSLLFSEASYAYTPAIGYTISGTLTLSDQDVYGPAHLGADLRRRRPITAPDRYAVYRASRIGSAVVDLIRSMAKREVTFFSGTVAISFL